jgi:hypothetical protein
VFQLFLRNKKLNHSKMTENLSEKFLLIKDILLEMDLKIVKEDEADELVIVENEHFF